MNDLYRQATLSFAEREAMKLAREAYGHLTLRDAIGMQASGMPKIYVDTLTSEAQRILQQSMISANMSAQSAMAAIEASQQNEMLRMLKWFKGDDSLLAGSLAEKSKAWLTGLTGAAALENAWAGHQALLSDGLTEYAERARTQLLTANSQIEALYGNEAIKTIWAKYANPHAFFEPADSADEDELELAHVESGASTAEVETLRLTIQSLGDTARALHELATAPGSKNIAERANIVATRTMVIGYIALFVTILAVLMAPFWDVYVKECVLKGDPKCKSYPEYAGAGKSIKDDASFDLYRSTRRIAARDLTMRLNAKGLSPAVANIRTGHLVIVLREGADWTLIEADVSGSKQAGWVYTRYLNKF